MDCTFGLALPGGVEPPDTGITIEVSGIKSGRFPLVPKVTLGTRTNNRRRLTFCDGNFTGLPAALRRCYAPAMSTMAEIESAIAHLPAAEREALEGRLLARRFGLEALDAGERAALLASLDEAEREIDSGRGLSADDLRRDVRAWAGR